MASAPKYRHTHTNALGQVVDIYFDKEDYSGPVESVKLGPGVFKRRDSDPDSDEMSPVRPWVAEIPIPASAIGLLDDVFSDSSRWWVRRVVDGTLDRYGIISKDDRERDDELIPDDSYLVAYDGLGWLATIPFVADDGTVESLLDLGPKPWIYWVLFILNKLGFEMGVATAANWYTPDMNQAQSPLHQEYVPPGCYLSTEAPPPDCYYVLKDLLKGYNAFIYMEDEKWHIYQRELMIEESFSRTIYPHDFYNGGPGYSIDTYLPRYELTNPNLMKSGPTSPLRKAYSAVQVNHLHGAVESIIENPGFSRRYEESGAGGWEASGNAVIKAKDIGRGVDGEPGQNQAAYLSAIHSLLGLTVDNQLDLGDDHWTTKNPRQAEAGKEFIVAPRIYLELTAAGRAAASDSTLFQANLLITAVEEDDTTWYLSHDPSTEVATWSSSKKRCSVYVSPEEWQTPIVRTPALPAKARISLRLESVVEFGPIGYDYRTLGIWYDNILVFPAPEDEDVSTARTEVIDYVDRAAGSLRDPIEVHHGTGPSTAHQAATVDVDGNLLTDWKAGPYSGEPDSGLTKAQLLAHQVLTQVRTGSKVKKVGFLKQVPISCIRTIEHDSRLWLATHIEEDDETNEKTATLVELRVDAFTADFDTRREDGAQYLVPSTGRGVQHLFRGQNEAVEDLAVRQALTYLSDDVGPGIIDELPVEVTDLLKTTVADLERGKPIVVMGLRGKSWQMTLAQTHVAGNSRLKIQPFDLGTDFMPKGSGVHASEAERANTLGLTRDTTYNIIQQNSLALLNASYSEAEVDAIQVSAIAEQIRSGQALALFRKDGTIAAEFWVVHNAPKGAKRISISAKKPIFDDVIGASGAVIGRVHTNQVNVSITAADGSAIKRSDRAEQLESTATSSSFNQTVTRAEFNALKKSLEEVYSGPVQQLTDTLGDPVLVNGSPITFGKKLRDIIPEHDESIQINGSAIQQVDDRVTVIVAGVDPNTVNLATINVRVGDNEAEVATHTLVLSNNGLTSGTNITQRADDNAASITSHAGIFTANGLSAVTNITQDVADNSTDIQTNVTAITSIDTTLTNNGLSAVTNITQSVSDNSTDIETNATAITSIDTTLTNNGLSAVTNITQSVSDNAYDIGVNASALTSISTTLTNNGLSAITNITQSVSDNSYDIGVNANALTSIDTTLTNNGVTSSTNITQRVDTIGARTVVSASHEGGGVYTLATLDMEAGTGGSAITLSGDLVRLNANTVVEGSFTVTGSNVHITSATTFDNDVTINGTLNGVGGSFSGDLTGSSMSLTGTLTMTDGVKVYYVDADGSFYFNGGQIGSVTISGASFSAPETSPGVGPTMSFSAVSVSIHGDLGVDITTDPAQSVTVNGDIVVTEGLSFVNQLGNSTGNASGKIPISNGTVCTNLNAEKVGGWAKTDLVKRSSGPSSNSSTPMPNYTKTIALEDSSGNAITLYGT